LLGVAGWRRLLLRRIHYHEGVPEIVKDTSARVLEFDLLRELLRGYAASDLGRSKVAAMAASRDLEWIRRQHQLTSEVREFRRCSGGFEFAGLVNISPLLQKAQISGAALETTEIRDTVGTVDRAAGWREIALNPPQGMKQDWRAVRELSAGIGDFTEFLRGFRNAILPDGTLEDRASPSLAGIRREIEKQKRAIQDSLRSHLRRLSEGETLQEEVVTIRGERFVIPVKTEHKRRVQGVVHGASSSGQTVFIEPLETIEQNNELVRLLEEEQAEIAKARFAEEYECVAPLIGEDVPRRPSGPPSAGSTSAAPPPQPRDSSFVMRVIRCSSGICGQRVALLSPQPSNSNANSGS
jgi:DNA mismatch repair protein MutS2